MTGTRVEPPQTEAASRPSYEDLPLQASSKVPHAWDVFGPGDEVGTVNRLTDAAVAAAARAVGSGRRVNLSLPITQPDPPLFRRAAIRHSIKKGEYGWDDVVDNFNLQGSTQWDGLRHIRGRSDGFYGGWSGDDTAEPDRLGIQRWAERGIIGRGILADVASSGEWRDRDPFEGDPVTPASIERALEDQGTVVRDGDVLCVRTGWMDRYLALSDAEREELARAFDGGLVPWRGLSGDGSMARYLWDGGFSAVAVDNPGVEVSPGDPWFGTLHRRLIPGLGFAIGELFVFGELATLCRASDRFEFFFVSVPLNVPGGVGTPANALAIL